MSRKTRRKRKQQRRAAGRGGVSLAPRQRTAPRRTAPPRVAGEADLLPPPGTPTGALLAMRHEQSSFSGPLPPPEFLQAYDSALPGTAERIVGAWETESTHRRGIEKDAVAMDVALVRNEIWLSRAGMIIGAVISLAFLVAAVYLALHDAAAPGEQVDELVTGPRPEQIEQPVAERRRLRADDALRIRQPRPRDVCEGVVAGLRGRETPTAGVDDRLPRPPRPRRPARARASVPAPDAHLEPEVAPDHREQIGQGLARGGERPAVGVAVHARDELAVVDLAREVGVVAVVALCEARVRWVGVDEPEGAVGANARDGVPPEPVRGLAARRPAELRVAPSSRRYRSAAPGAEPCAGDRRVAHDVARRVEARAATHRARRPSRRRWSRSAPRSVMRTSLCCRGAADALHATREPAMGGHTCVSTRPSVLSSRSGVPWLDLELLGGDPLRGEALEERDRGLAQERHASLRTGGGGSD